MTPNSSFVSYWSLIKFWSLRFCVLLIQIADMAFIYSPIIDAKLALRGFFYPFQSFHTFQLAKQWKVCLFFIKTYWYGPWVVCSDKKKGQFQNRKAVVISVQTLIEKYLDDSLIYSNHCIPWSCFYMKTWHDKFEGCGNSPPYSGSCLELLLGIMLKIKVFGALPVHSPLVLDAGTVLVSVPPLICALPVSIYLPIGMYQNMLTPYSAAQYLTYTVHNAYCNYQRTRC